MSWEGYQGLWAERMSIPVDDLPMIELAAAGDREAQTILRDGLLAECNMPERTLSHLELVIKAEVFARLAAAHGGAMDKLYLGAVLLLRSEHFREAGEADLAEAFQFEAFNEFDALLALGDTDALAILANAASRKADDGDEIAGLMLGRIVESLTPKQAAAVSAAVRNFVTEA